MIQPPYPDWRASFDAQVFEELKQSQRRIKLRSYCRVALLWGAAGLGALACVKLILWLER